MWYIHFWRFDPLDFFSFSLPLLLFSFSFAFSLVYFTRCSAPSSVKTGATILRPRLPSYDLLCTFRPPFTCKFLDYPTGANCYVLSVYTRWTRVTERIIPVRRTFSFPFSYSLPPFPSHTHTHTYFSNLFHALSSRSATRMSYNWESSILPFFLGRILNLTLER